MSRCICFTVTKFHFRFYIFIYLDIKFNIAFIKNLLLPRFDEPTSLSNRTKQRSLQFLLWDDDAAASAAAALLPLLSQLKSTMRQQTNEPNTDVRTDERTGERANERVETVNSKTFEQLESEFQLSAPHNRTARKNFLN